MKQLTLAAVGFERYVKTTRRAAFLTEMERIVPWSALCGLIEPFYPKPGNGRPPVGVERMLRLYFLQQWFLKFLPLFCGLRGGGFRLARLAKRANLRSACPYFRKAYGWRASSA